MNLRLLITVLKQEILSTKSFLLVIILSSLFIFTSFIIINLQSLVSVAQSGYPFFSIMKIMGIIIFGSFYAISTLDIVLVIIMGLLFGLNLTLLINKFNALKRRGNLRIAFGTGIISIFAAGCASCGLSFASLIGITAALSLLPFGGIELYFLAIAILLISIYFNLKQIIKVCAIA